MRFGYEDLDVWRRSIDFAVRVINVIEEMDLPRKHFRLLEQIESSVTSVASNIAEGKGRHSKKEYMHFIYVSRGSLYEAVTQLEILHKMKWITDEDYEKLKSEGVEIARMLMGLVKGIKKSL